MTKQLVKAVPLLGQNGPSNLQPLKSGHYAHRAPHVRSEPAERLVYKHDKAAPEPADEERQARERMVQVLPSIRPSCFPQAYPLDTEIARAGFAVTRA
jgi:hypothetical protein